jgi:hypothetical protein
MLRSPDSLALAMATTGDPTDQAMSSGWPASLSLSLREVVGRLVPISDRPSQRAAAAALIAGALSGLRPSDLRRPRTAKSRLRRVGESGSAFAAARARTVDAQLAGAGALDGFIQNGADYRVRAPIPMATFQDSTVLQAARAYDWPHLRGLSARDLDGLFKRQRAAYASAAACCAATHWVRESIIRDYGIPSSKVHVVGLGANHRFPETDSARRNWARPRFLFVGVDWERKNGQSVLDAFGEVQDRFPEATLDLVGGHPRVELAGVRGHGHLAIDEPGARAQLTTLYSEATAFVMPSVHEPAGTVHIEAAEAGIASIGTTNGGAATCIGDGGFVVDPNDPRELLHAMLELCDPVSAARLGALARRHAQQFTWRKVAERLVRALAIPDVDVADLAPLIE